MTVEVLLTFGPEDAEEWAQIDDRLRLVTPLAKTVDVMGVPEEWSHHE